MEVAREQPPAPQQQQAEEKDSVTTQQQQQQQQRRKPFQELDLGGDPQKQQQENQHMQKPQQQQQQQQQQPGVGTMRGAPTPSPRRKSPARKKARTSLENDLGKANLGNQDDQRSDLNIAKTPPQKQANDQKKRAKGELIEFSPDSQGSGPALRFSDSSDESGDDEDEAEIQQHGMNDNADRETQRVEEDDNDDDDDDSNSDDMDTSTEDHFVSISAASTPSLPEVELNTRRNALRPVHSERKSAASAGTADLEDLLNSDEDDDSDNGHLDDDEANRTVTLAAFQNILAGADDDDEDEVEDAGDRGNEHAGKGQKGVRTRNGTPAKPKKVTSTPFDDSDNDDTPARNGNRRNTASPSALQRLLEMADSEDEDDDEEEQLNAATARGRREAELLAKDDDKLFQVSTPEDSKSSARAQENDDVTPVALRTRSSAKKPPRPESQARTPGNIAELGPGPTPLKSCISARKKRGTSARQKKKSVVFGSPDAAEFDYQDPVRGGVTPLNKNYARTRYKMEDRVDSDDEDLIEEDRETALNSSILATWEEEEEEEDEAMDDDNDEDEGSRNSVEQGIQSAGSRRSRSSRGSRRSSMGVFRAGSRKTSEEVPSPSVRSEDDKSELEQKFDAVAAENHRSPPPSPETAEDVLRKGDAVAMRPRTPAQIAGAVASASSSPDPSLANSNGDTIDFQELHALAASTPGSEGNAANRTVDLDDFDSVLDAHSSGGSRRSSRVARRTSNASAASATSTGTSSGNRTIDLDDLTALAALSPVVAAASPARNTRSQQRRRASEARQQRKVLDSHLQADSDDEDHNDNDHDHDEEAARTVELGQLSELAALDQSTNDSRVDSDVEMEDANEHRPKSPSSSPSKEEHTVELGTLSQLASMSPESAGPPSALKQSSLPPPPATEGAEERTVELGNLSDLAAMTPENESVAGRRTRRTSARIAAASSGTKHESTRKGTAATPQDRTVDLGNLSELAAMTPESEPRPNQRRDSGPTASEEKTKELGSLTELAELSPATPATPATPAETKEMAKESQASPTASSPHMRLSFSSLGSSSQGSDKKNERDGKQGLQFDSAAVLDGFMNSPGSTTSSPRSREVTPNKSPALVSASARKPSLSPAEATDSASVAAAAAPFSPSPSSSPENEANQSAGPESTKGMDMTPETPEPANNTNASESAFRPRRALARTPLSAEQGTRDDAGTSPDIQEEDLSPPPTPKPTTTSLSLEAFLAQCEAPLSNESLHQDLGDAEDPSQDLVDDPEVEAQEVVDEELTRACVLQADMFGQKWTVNESRNRALLAQQTITELVTTLEQSSPSLLQVDAESGCVNLGLKKAIRTLREQALCEARASWSDIEAKGLSLSLQALEEHGSILREDIGIVQEGVQRLEAAGAQASEAVSSAERLLSLLEALLEQREVIGGYKQEIAELEERVRIADKDFTRVQSAHDVQAARLKEAQDNLEALEAQRQAEVDFESQNAVLDVAQGLHIWRLHNASGTSVELALDNVDGSYELITFVFDLQPSVVEIHSQHVGPDALETEDRPQVDIEEAFSSLGVEAKMATITKARVAHTVAALRSRLRGAEPSCVPDALLELDVEFGRLHDLWEEISQICQSETYPCKLTARGDGSMVFSVEIYYGGLGAVVKVAFEILPSYPLDTDACKVSFELVSERNHDQLLQHLEQAVVQRNDDAKQFAPLSSLWAGILENF